MKTIAKLTASLMLFLITIALQAQTTSSSSKSSSTTSTHSDSDDGNSSYSYSHSSDKDGKNQNSNVSVSISNSNDSYKLRAKFPKEKYDEVKTILLKELNQKNYKAESSETHRWTSSNDKNRVYDVTLSGTKLSIDLDKDVASSSLSEKFKALGLTIRTVIVGEQNQARRNAERLQRDADRLRRDAEHMQREADRLERDAERRAEDVSKQYRDDAKRIADEARRLADEASGLNTEARHKGGISSMIKKLLKESKTYLSNNSKEGNNWNWPSAQKAFLEELIKDGMISNKDNNISFTKDETGTYLNGHKLNKQQIRNYKNIFEKHGIAQDNDFSFYKINDHIAIISSNANLESFIKDAVYKGVLSSKNDKVKLEINGNSGYKNGAQLSLKELTTINKILLKNNIIPAPGKIFEILKPGTFKLGYSIDDKTHFGTWVLKN